MNTIKFKRLHPDAKLPTYATDGAACFDFYAIDKVRNVFGRAVVETGLAVEVPHGYALRIYGRSGLAFNSAVHAFEGTVDSDFRGPLRILLVHERNGTITIDKGDRIAQGLIVPAPQYPLEWADELSETERGSGGFGSTGT